MSERLDDPLALERQLCLDLSAAARAVVSLYRPLLAPHGLTHPQYLVLVALWEGGERSVTELGRALHLDSGTLSPLVRRLEANGLVRRTRPADDQRRVVIDLTDAGRALRDHAIHVHDGVAQSVGLTGDELNHLHGMLAKVVESAERAGAPAE